MTDQEQAGSDESKQTQNRNRSSREGDRPKGPRPESDGGDRQRNRRSGSGRKSAYKFDDQMERAVCQLVTHDPPQGFPVNRRAELAVMPTIEVARTDTMILFCDHLHSGPHMWPNGDEVPD